MVTPRLQDNLNKLLGLLNNSEDVLNCRMVIINNYETWRKNIREAIHGDNTLFKSKNYCITLERFINDDCFRIQKTGLLTIEIDNMLKTIDSLECMIITISNINNVYSKEKKGLYKPKFVYVILQNI